MLMKHEDQLKMMSAGLHLKLSEGANIDQAKQLASLVFRWSNQPMMRDELYAEFGHAAGWTEALAQAAHAGR